MDVSSLSLSSFFIRLVFFELLTTGILAGFHYQNRIAPFSATVNAVACVHYFKIHNIRLTVEDDVNDAVVDLLRHSDWFITLPLMTYELHILAEVNPDYKYLLFPKEAAALLSALVIVCSGVWRFVCNEVRCPVSAGKQVLGIVSMVAAISLLCLCLCNLLFYVSPIMSHYLAINALSLVWIGYPFVALLQRAFLPVHISLYKDVSYGILDIVSKGGLAWYACVI